jgi:hypothetical protein
MPVHLVFLECKMRTSVFSLEIVVTFSEFNLFY